MGLTGFSVRDRGIARAIVEPNHHALLRTGFSLGRGGQSDSHAIESPRENVPRAIAHRDRLTRMSFRTRSNDVTRPAFASWMNIHFYTLRVTPPVSYDISADICLLCCTVHLTVNACVWRKTLHGSTTTTRLGTKYSVGSDCWDRNTKLIVDRWRGTHAFAWVAQVELLDVAPQLPAKLRASSRRCARVECSFFNAANGYFDITEGRDIWEPHDNETRKMYIRHPQTFRDEIVVTMPHIENCNIYY